MKHSGNTHVFLKCLQHLPAGVGSSSQLLVPSEQQIPVMANCIPLFARSSSLYIARPHALALPYLCRSLISASLTQFRTSTRTSGVQVLSRKSSILHSYPRSICRSLTTVNVAIAVGDKLPDAIFSYLDKEGNIQTVTVADLTKGKKAVLFAVPGAFTPTCSQQHLPGFMQKAEELRSKGVDTIACIAVNDAFVLRAWGESIGVGDKVLLLSDGNAVFTKALGVTLDLSDKPVGLGVRSRRYSLLADDGIVKVLNLEEGGSFTTSGAEEIMKVL